MQFTIPATAFMAFVSGALAQVAGFDTIYKPEKGEVVSAGDSLTIVWEAAPAEYDDETISIYLLSGATPETLVPSEEPIVAGVINSDGEYVWAVPAALGDDETYGFRIELESDASVFQYSFPFKIDGSGAQPSGTDDGEVTATSDCTTLAPEPTIPSNSTTLTSTYVEEPTEEPEPEEPEVEEPETDEPVEGAASANSVVGTVALFGAAAVAAFAF
jgi:hypothetical protein